MNREIKFRVWDKKHKVFIKLHLNSLESNLTGIGSDDAFYFIKTRHNLRDYPRKIVFSDIEDCVFQQFTGLLDKNGVEIYEGDMVSRHGIIKVVEWSGGDDNDFQGYDLDNVFGKWEIINNIFNAPRIEK